MGQAWKWLNITALTWPEFGHMAPRVAAGEAREMWSRHIPGREMKWGWVDSKPVSATRATS